MKPRSRKYFHKKHLIHTVRSCFEQIEDTKASRGFTLVDYLMSGFAIFSLKCASLLEFDQKIRNGSPAIIANMKRLFGVNRVPSDSGMRKRLDEVDPFNLRGAFKTIFAQLQRGKILEGFRSIENHVLLAIDGTGMFSSKSVHCQHCCEKQHRNGTKTYFHHMLCAALVHPFKKIVIPLMPEAIIKSDGATKNDSERNACKRFLEHFRREHPHLKTIVVQDGLFSNAPYLRLLGYLNLRYIIGAKPGDHTFMFNYIDRSDQTQEVVMEVEGIQYRFRYHNDVPLNASNPEVRVNVLEVYETRPGTKKQSKPRTTRFSWVTDLPLDEKNLMKIMRAGRSRWRIENETINTLKNQGYNFEHNYGHGYKHLSTVFACLMMLAFLVDQVEQLCDVLFQGALESMGRLKYLRERVRSLFREFVLESWEFLYRGMAEGFRVTVEIDSS